MIVQGRREFSFIENKEWKRMINKNKVNKFSIGSGILFWIQYG